MTNQPKIPSNVPGKESKGVGSGVAPGGVDLQVGTGIGSAVDGDGSVGNGVFGAGEKRGRRWPWIRMKRRIQRRRKRTGVGEGAVGRGSLGNSVFGAFVSDE